MRYAWVLLGVLVGCTPWPQWSCNDYAEPEMRLRCQNMVLGAYMQGQSQMMGRWNETFRQPVVEPAQGQVDWMGLGRTWGQSNRGLSCYTNAEGWTQCQ